MKWTFSHVFLSREALGRAGLQQKPQVGLAVGKVGKVMRGRRGSNRNRAEIYF